MGVTPNSSIEAFKRKAATSDFQVGVLGLGYVGLPLAIQFAKSGFRVVGVDINSEKTEILNRGESYIDDVPGEEVASLVKSEKFRATDDLDVLSQLDSISVCVPTPLSKFREPDLSSVALAGEEIKNHLRKEQLVVLESTTYPGTTEEMFLPILEESGLKVGEDFFLAFSPERVDPGRRDFMIHNTPRVLGGVTESCLEAAMTVYGRAIETVVPVSSPKAAEMTKLLENTFRSVNIALANEVAFMCDRLGIPVFEVIRAAASKPFGFLPFFPGPGLGGHCLPIDPLYLSWKLKSLNYEARFIGLADEINRSMPTYLVNKITDALNRHSKPVNMARILLLGIAYKKDVDDTRESPALDILNALIVRNASVNYHDPFVPILDVEGIRMASVPLDDEVLSETDCAVIVTDHSQIDYERLVRSVPLVVDARDATDGFRHLGDVVTI